jgi:hypothetical protein
MKCDTVGKLVGAPPDGTVTWHSYGRLAGRDRRSPAEVGEEAGLAEKSSAAAESIRVDEQQEHGRTPPCFL